MAQDQNWNTWDLEVQSLPEGICLRFRVHVSVVADTPEQKVYRPSRRNSSILYVQDCIGGKAWRLYLEVFCKCVADFLPDKEKWVASPMLNRLCCLVVSVVPLRHQ
jgi:hypothetical protein